MRSPQLIGLVLWRGGLLLAAAAGLYYSSWWLLARYFALVPTQLKIGMALLLAGLMLVMASLIVERWRDATLEGNLRE